MSDDLLTEAMAEYFQKVTPMSIEKETHAYKPPLGLCVTCGRPRREHKGEISLELMVSRIAFLLGVNPTQTAIENEINKLKAIRYDRELSNDENSEG